MDKKFLDSVLEQFSIKEIVEYAISKSPDSEKQVVDALLKLTPEENNFNSDNVEELIRHAFGRHSEFCKENNLIFHRDRIQPYEVMSIIMDFYPEDSILDYFDDDDLLKHLDGSFALDKHDDEIESQCIQDAEEEYKKDLKRFHIYSLQELNPYDFRRYLCDLTDLPYYATDAQLFSKLKDNSKSYYPV